MDSQYISLRLIPFRERRVTLSNSFLSIMCQVEFFFFIFTELAEMDLMHSCTNVLIMHAVCRTTRHLFPSMIHCLLTRASRQFPAIGMLLRKHCNMPLCIQVDLVRECFYGRQLLFPNRFNLNYISIIPAHAAFMAVGGFRICNSDLRRTLFFYYQLKLCIYTGCLNNLILFGGFSSFRNRVDLIKMLTHMFDNHVGHNITIYRQRVLHIINLLSNSFTVGDAGRIPLFRYVGFVTDYVYDDTTINDPLMPGFITGTTMMPSMEYISYLNNLPVSMLSFNWVDLTFSGYDLGIVFDSGSGVVPQE